MADSESYSTFEELRARLDQIVDEVNAEGVSLDEALALYEEAVRLGLSACDLSERDVEQILSQEDEAAAEDAASQDPAQTPQSAGNGGEDGQRTHS